MKVPTVSCHSVANLNASHKSMPNTSSWHQFSMFICVLCNFRTNTYKPSWLQPMFFVQSSSCSVWSVLHPYAFISLPIFLVHPQLCTACSVKSSTFISFFLYHIDSIYYRSVKNSWVNTIIFVLNFSGEWTVAVSKKKPKGKKETSPAKEIDSSNSNDLTNDVAVVTYPQVWKCKLWLKTIDHTLLNCWEFQLTWETFFLRLLTSSSCSTTLHLEQLLILLKKYDFT